MRPLCAQLLLPLTRARRTRVLLRAEPRHARTLRSREARRVERPEGLPGLRLCGRGAGADESAAWGSSGDAEEGGQRGGVASSRKEGTYRAMKGDVGGIMVSTFKVFG